MLSMLFSSVAWRLHWCCNSVYLRSALLHSSELASYICFWRAKWSFKPATMSTAPLKHSAAVYRLKSHSMPQEEKLERMWAGYSACLPHQRLLDSAADSRSRVQVAFLSLSSATLEVLLELQSVNASWSFSAESFRSMQSCLVDFSMESQSSAWLTMACSRILSWSCPFLMAGSMRRVIMFASLPTAPRTSGVSLPDIRAALIWLNSSSSPLTDLRISAPARALPRIRSLADTLLLDSVSTTPVDGSAAMTQIGAMRATRIVDCKSWEGLPGKRELIV
mmetsp:Transcript_36397/g.87520  ORF Transcript_36397/g.87520 Transcript_36397/m.87520 type:complete len:278 (+) Transcript_36397:487-1320(+)